MASSTTQVVLICGLLLLTETNSGCNAQTDFSNQFVSTGLASTLAGLSQDQIDEQIATLRNGDTISINNVRYVSLRSAGRYGDIMILVEAKGQSDDPCATRIRDSSYSSAVPFGASPAQDVVGHSINSQAIIGQVSAGSSYSAPSMNRQNVVAAAVNSGAGVNDPSALSYSSPANFVRQSGPRQVAGRDRSSYSSASDINGKKRPQIGHDGAEKWDYGDSIAGIAGQDYPILSLPIKATSFSCDARREGGYYADVDSACQVYHVCALNKKFSFLCPNGTVFDQKSFVCNWWYNVDCASSPNYFDLNNLIGVAPKRPQLLAQASLVETPSFNYGPPKQAYGAPLAVQAVLTEPAVNRPSYELEPPPVIQASVTSSTY